MKPVVNMLLGGVAIMGCREQSLVLRWENPERPALELVVTASQLELPKDLMAGELTEWLVADGKVCIGIRTPSFRETSESKSRPSSQ